MLRQVLISLARPLDNKHIYCFHSIIYKYFLRIVSIHISQGSTIFNSVKFNMGSVPTRVY